MAVRKGSEVIFNDRKPEGRRFPFDAYDGGAAVVMKKESDWIRLRFQDGTEFWVLPEEVAADK